jgi:hypothetical protein
MAVTMPRVRTDFAGPAAVVANAHHTGITELLRPGDTIYWRTGESAWSVVEGREELVDPYTFTMPTIP